ncbi:hypothetical protein EMCRGX_G003638 [Ephydatia muelleri]
MPGYVPKRKLLSDPGAIRALEGALTRTSIYHYAAHYCRCRDTYWIESFNHQLLTYLSKRVHFRDDTFVIRMNLAVLDWCTNVVQGDEEEGSNDDGFLVPGLEDGDFVDDDDDDNDDADDIVEDEM